MEEQVCDNGGQGTLEHKRVHMYTPAYVHSVPYQLAHTQNATTGVPI